MSSPPARNVCAPPNAAFTAASRVSRTRLSASQLNREALNRIDNSCRRRANRIRDCRVSGKRARARAGNSGRRPSGGHERSCFRATGRENLHRAARQPRAPRFAPIEPALRPGRSRRWCRLRVPRGDTCRSGEKSRCSHPPALRAMSATIGKTPERGVLRQGSGFGTLRFGPDRVERGNTAARPGRTRLDSHVTRRADSEGQPDDTR